jgi:hypothetical protein
MQWTYGHGQHLRATALPPQALDSTATRRRSAADKALHAAATFWFVIALVGQLMFAVYVAAFYGGAAARGDYGRWNDVLVGGWVAGSVLGNLVLVAHLLLAVVMTIGGPLQLIPQIRARALRLHRWNGRLYVPAAIIISVSGLYSVWTRGTAGGVNLALGVSLNAVLIIVFAVMVLRLALARRIDLHRRWALRLFMAVSGVWFFRVGMMLWLVVNQGPLGFGENFDGPFPTVFGFVCYLLPLAILELYLRVQDGARTAGRFAMASALVVLTLAMGTGIAMAIVGLWLPRI